MRCTRILMLWSLLAVNACVAAQAPEMSIDPLRRRIDEIEGEAVSIDGWVSAEKPTESPGFKSYYLRDRFGSLVHVRTTAGVPEIQEHLRVVGIVRKETGGGDIYLSERSREIVNGWLRYALFGAAVVLLAIGGLLLSLRRSSAAAPQPQPPQPKPGPSPEPKPSPTPAPAPEPPEIEDYPTLKVYKTAKVLPGRLVVIEDSREGDAVYLYDQTGAGEIEIGRETPGLSHGLRIKVSDPMKSRTISRRQARIAYSAGSKRFTVTNLADEESNPTIVNKRELARNESVDLSDGDRIVMGLVEFKFVAGAHSR